MDFNSTYAPPINNACVPNIYNRLDAEVIERTRVANNQLNMRLLLEQKILAKYKHEAERFLLLEKSRVTKDLARITQTLPTVTSLRDFEDKFFRSGSRADQMPQQKRKNYQAAKNEDPVCRRCYIHHLPTKKKFYRYKLLPQLPPVLNSKPKPDITRNHSHDQNVKIEVNSSTSQVAVRNQIVNDVIELDLEEVESLHSQDQTRNFEDRLIPVADAFKFLEREKWGRERDLNHTFTPRLMPNEIWKNVVKNVCSQYPREHRAPSANLRHPNVNERKSGIKSRRSSIVVSSKPYEKSDLHPGKLSKGASRINLFRRPSISNESKPNSDAKSLYENNIKINTPRRSSIAKTDHPRHLSRSNSTLMQSNHNNNANKTTESTPAFSKYGRKDNLQNVNLPLTEREIGKTSAGRHL